MKKLFLVLTLLAMVVTSSALAVEKGQIVLNPDPQFERRPVDDSRIDLVYESFEDAFPPAGWTTMTSGISYTWVQSGLQAYSGAYSAYCQWGNQGEWQDEWLITPALDTSGLGTLFVEFMETGYYWASYGYDHSILVSTTTPDDPANFTEIWHVTPDDYPAPWLDSAGAEWGQVSVSLADYIGQTIYIAVRYEGEWADDWWIDDFRVFEPNAHDVKALEVVPNNEIWLAGEEITPQFTIKNIGANAETFEAEMVILRNDAPFYTEYVTVDGLGSGEEIAVDFPSFICEVGAYDLTGTAVLEGDEDPDNNMATASNGCYAQGRTPFGILYTEWGCGPCVPANQAMDEWYPTQGNEAGLIRVHVWWPAGNDPMYHANVEQNNFLHGMCPTNVNGVPTLYMDNTWDMWDYFQADWMETILYGYGWSAITPSPLEMEINYDQGAGVAYVAVNVVDPMAEGDYVVYVAVTEDGIEMQGPNGEPVHNQAFRWLFPNEEGIPLVNEVGVQEFMVPIELSEDWVYENLRATTWVMQVPNGVVLNCATMFLTEGVVSIEDGEEVAQELPTFQTRLAGAHPNPFNPMTTISFTLAREQRVKLSVFDMAGKRVAELANGAFAAGDHPVIWNGQDLHGREVASGTYMIYMETEDQVRSSKMMLVR